MEKQEEKALESIANNRAVMSAIEKVFMSKIPKPMDFHLSKDNQDLGADLRASITAYLLLKEGLKEISRYGKNKLDKNKGRNPAV